jgi:FlaA1/EpsC-like NDP-sugar epimerase
VLGSNGSVVKIFRKQIKSGGPVTVTHPEITRYFMTIPEACQLVLEASIMGHGSDIFVFDMGEPVKVAELAKKMINLAGLKVNEDIEILFTGLRPGEKLYEELLCSSENTIETHHPKIMIANVDHILNGSVAYLINELKNALSKNDQFALVKLLKSGIPDYRSNNSKFEQLDKKIAESA